ncbi:MAG: DUF4192 family protein [Candidatus Nanopelagicales bacterium]
MTRPTAAHAVTPAIALRTPQALAAGLPHLLGFHPDESLVCVWMLGNEVVVVQRADLPMTDIDKRYIEAYFACASNIAADEVMVVCITRRTGVGEQTIEHVTEWLGQQVDVGLRGALIVCGSRVRDLAGEWQWVSSYDRQRAACAFDTDMSSSPVQRSRADVAREVDFDDHFPVVPQDPHAESATGLDGLRDILADGRWTAVAARRALRAGASSVRGRDLVIWWCATCDIPKRRELLRALLAGLRTTPPGSVAELACAAAAVAWMCGDGVRSNAALNRCLEEDPGNTMGRMLESAISTALAPADFARMIAEVPPGDVGADA